MSAIRDTMNRRLYNNNQSFVETTIYPVFVMIYRCLLIEIEITTSL
ncbi:MAG: hypothetical protein V7K98_12685 [Nostoc sp.]